MKSFVKLLFLAGITASAQLSIKQYTKNDFHNYWYTGKAEISSYELEQARYGEIRKGKAVNIFVTEPFSKKSNTKANHQSSENTTVLKLNATKKFNTGIYPYSIMTSSFFPVQNAKSSLKISSSTQEWCGHEYTELISKNNNFILNNTSYFEGKSYNNKSLPLDIVLEDDIWSILRIKPQELPIGNFKALPSFVYVRLSHIETKAYLASGTITQKKNKNTYTITYPNLNRSLSITFKNEFPYSILNWKETYFDGYGSNKKRMTTKATLIETLNIDYWNKKSNKDLELRKKLGL